MKKDTVKLVTHRFSDIEAYILGRVEAYETALFGPAVEYEYGNFPINENNTAVVYYPAADSKFKLELQKLRAHSEMVNMALLVPYSDTNELRDSLVTYSKNTKILICVNEMAHPGSEMIVESILREHMNPNFAMLTHRQHRSTASYCKYSSNRFKWCAGWIGKARSSQRQASQEECQRGHKRPKDKPQEDSYHIG